MDGVPVRDCDAVPVPVEVLLRLAEVVAVCEGVGVAVLLAVCDEVGVRLGVQVGVREALAGGFPLVQDELPQRPSLKHVRVLTRLLYTLVES